MVSVSGIEVRIAIVTAVLVTVIATVTVGSGGPWPSERHFGMFRMCSWLVHALKDPNNSALRSA